MFAIGSFGKSKKFPLLGERIRDDPVRRVKSFDPYSCADSPVAVLLQQSPRSELSTCPNGSTSRRVDTEGLGQLAKHSGGNH